MLKRVADERNTEPISADGDDSQTHAVHGNRALTGDEFPVPTRKTYFQNNRIADFPNFPNISSCIHMPLNQMTVKPVVHAKRALQIQIRSFPEKFSGCFFDRLWHIFHFK